MTPEKIYELVEAVTNHGITVEMCDLEHEDCDIVKTSETMDDWVEARKNWREQGSYESGQHDGIPYLFFENAQAVKGQQRKDVCIIDCGDHRLVMHFEGDL